METALNSPEYNCSKDEADIPVGVTDSKLMPLDFVNNNDRQE